MGYVTLVPLWVYIAQKDKQTREVLYTGWTPVVLAMMISRYASQVHDLKLLSSYDSSYLN